MRTPSGGIIPHEIYPMRPPSHYLGTILPLVFDNLIEMRFSEYRRWHAGFAR